MGTFSWTVSIWSILFWYWDRYSAFSEDYLWSTSLIVFFFTGSGNSTVDSELWKPRMREVTDEKGFQHLPRRLRAIYPFRQSPSAKCEQKKNQWKKLMLARCAIMVFFSLILFGSRNGLRWKGWIALSIWHIVLAISWSVGRSVGLSVSLSVCQSVSRTGTQSPSQLTTLAAYYLYCVVFYFLLWPFAFVSFSRIRSKVQ